MKNLELLMAFDEWARPRGYDLALTATKNEFANLETRNAWLGWEGAHGPDGCRPYGQQLYASIKRDSEYAHQSDKLFPVSVGKPLHSQYTVAGGPGGCYRLADVDLFVMEDGKAWPLR